MTQGGLGNQVGFVDTIMQKIIKFLKVHEILFMCINESLFL